MKPHQVTDPELHGRLHAQIKRTLDTFKPEDRGYMAYGVISRAAEFFAFCPDDFCVQHANWDEGHAVFGGTNRLLWSVRHGFSPDRTYCSARFNEQFDGPAWDRIGELNCEGAELCLVSSHHLNLEAGEILPRVRIPLAWAGLKIIYGRKSTKGDGKIAEVKFLTGAEA